MRKIRLDAEEKGILSSIDKDEFMPVTGKELREVANAIASRKKNKTLTIRVNENDIQKIKKLAQEKHIPYQSYLSEIIHRVAIAL